jgi:hypothetical protein
MFNSTMFLFKPASVLEPFGPICAGRTLGYADSRASAPAEDGSGRKGVRYEQDKFEFFLSFCIRAFCVRGLDVRVCDRAK